MQTVLEAHCARQAQAATPRLDLYRPIHQALRAALADKLVRLGALDLNDRGECLSVLGGLTQLLGLIDSHLHHEETFIHPALHAAEPGVVQGTDAEHAEHRAEMAALRRAAEALLQQPSDERLAALYRQFALFVAENHVHMHHEETVLNAVLWAHYSDAELARLHDQLLASIPPAELMATLAFMLPALTPPQRAGLLLGMRASAPPEAVAAVLSLAESVLDLRAWAQLKAAL
jgi:Hemerythrin HHE cation binding domain